MKKKYRSKTLGWAAVLGVLAILVAIPEVQAIVPVQAMPYFLALAAVVTAVLRAVTSEPLA